MKITVVGCGYVGLSWAAVLAEKNEVTVWDIDENKLANLRHGKLPFADKELEKHLKEGKIKLNIPFEYKQIFNNSCMYIIAVPTNYSKIIDGFDMTILESVISDIIDNDCFFESIIIKSTVPIGFTDELRKKYNCDKIYYMPEFLREGCSYNDCKKPSRIIIGGSNAEEFVENEKAFIDSVSYTTVFYMSLKEAEAVKLFSNTYLAMRVAFFNEVDSFAENHELDASKIIEGICKDSRIGAYYNNPSFGYGGYCLPKDSKQLLKSLSGKDDCIVKAIVEQNAERKSHIVNHIIERKCKRIGVFRLLTKTKSDNIRFSAMLDIIEKLLQNTESEFIIYEPLVTEGLSLENYVQRITYVNSIEELAYESDIILANRKSKELLPYLYKVYTRDIFNRD